MAGLVVKVAQGLVNALWSATHRSANVGPFTRSGGSRSAYEGAATTRRMRGWTPRTGSPSTILAGEGEMLRERARDLLRNNPWAAAASEQFVTDVVGRGMRPWWGGLPKAQRMALKTLWSTWISEADSSGVTDFYGMQAVAFRAVFDVGECFVRLRDRRPRDGLVVPLQLEMLPGDMVPLGESRALPGGNVIRQGIEFDRLGRIVRYHFHPRHPGDFLTTRPNESRNFIPVPASEVIHIFRQTEPGQVRGVTGLSSVLRRLRALDFYDDAENERKGLASSIVGFLRKVEGYEPSEAAQAAVLPDGGTARDAVDEPWQIGTLLPLGDNEDVTFPTLPTAGDYDRYMPMQIRAIASGTGRTYEHVSQDLRGVSYSSARVSLVNLSRKVRAEQQRTLEHQFCRTVMKRWVRQAVVSGAISLPGYDENPYPFENPWWVPDGFEWIDPERQVRAATQECRSGFNARVLTMLRNGLDPDEVDDLNETDAMDQDTREINYDTDGRRPWTGQTAVPGDASAQQAGAEGAEDGGEDGGSREDSAA